MMCGNIVYYPNENIEIIYYKNFDRSYPTHTHAEHITIGYVTGGCLRLVCNGQENLYHAGDSFCVMPDIAHAIEPVNHTVYSMLCVCISADIAGGAAQNKIGDVKRLKQVIMDAPEHVFSIQDMAKSMGISPYHMIRQFKGVCGLTPHQFQIQCRVRKAQKMLEKGKSVVEAAYATGFCDQSHFDRCFHKIVRLTPSEYKQSIKR